MKKSIIIFAKGPSVLKCNREIVESHEDIAICNYPVLSNFFLNLIKDRVINYHFANCGTFDERYNNSVNKKINIKKIFNTNEGINHYKNYLKNNELFSDENLYQHISVEYFQKKFNFKPSSGVMMLKYILDTNLYDKITLVGFDNWEIGKEEYYYKPEDYSNKLKYLLGGVYSKKGIRLQKSEHSSEKTRYFLNNLKDNYPDISFNFITNDTKLL